MYLHVCFDFEPPSWISWGPPYFSKMAEDFGMAAGRHVLLLQSQIFLNIAICRGLLCKFLLSENGPDRFSYA